MDSIRPTIKLLLKGEALKFIGNCQRENLIVDLGLIRGKVFGVLCLPCLRGGAVAVLPPWMDFFIVLEVDKVGTEDGFLLVLEQILGNDGTMCMASGERFNVRRNAWEPITSMLNRR